MASEASVSEADKVNGVSDDNTEKQGDERDMLIRVKAITAELCDAQSELKLVKDTRDKYRDLYARFAKKCEELMIKLNETETARNVAEGDRERLQAFLTACCDEHNQDAYSLGVKLSRSRENYKALQGSLSLARSEVNRLERRVEELEEEVRNYRTRCELAKSVHEFEAEAQQESFDGEMNSLLKAKDIQIDREIRRADRAAQEATLLKIHCYGKERGMPHYSPSFSEALQEMEAIDAEIDRIDPAYATWKNRLKFHSDFERDGTVTHVNGDEREVTTQTMSSLRDDNRPTTD
ncbi:hypothetical protein FOL47_006452 [Perkinsus chesapeaki]|uniref:Uncharacterized protein n=1 Tax=Perkinsus chesapeaki TaxID=330153 RepID=A0A7J6MXY3_PERCH|nr:hypothetical protein FOL47_006452 [Perkinsus chesapeaki]